MRVLVFLLFEDWLQAPCLQSVGAKYRHRLSLECCRREAWHGEDVSEVFIFKSVEDEHFSEPILCIIPLD